MTFLRKIEQRAPWWCSIWRVFGLKVQKFWLFIRKSANIDRSIYRKAWGRVIEDPDQTSIYRPIGVATLLDCFIFSGESNHLLSHFKTANVNIWCDEDFISIDILSWSSFNFWTLAQKYQQTSLICIGSLISTQRTG